MKHVTCGILIFNEKKELLVCHVTGQEHWDIPKGQSDVGELPLTTAIRETHEETGLIFSPDQLFDLGEHDYAKKKNIHLFRTVVLKQSIILDKLTCVSQFVNLANVPQPEMDGYKWIQIPEIEMHCRNSMRTVLRKILKDELSEV